MARCGISLEGLLEAFPKFENPQKDFTIVAGTVVKYVGESPDPVIPDGVRKIGIEAFKGTNITSVTLSDTVDEIEESAFELRTI